MEEYKNKLEEIIDFEIKDINKTWNEDDIKKFEEKYKIRLPQDYEFYLQHYGNDYIKEAHCFIPSIELSKKIKQTQFEIDSLYGLYNDENNIEDKINLYKDIIPVDLIPVGDLPGGDLVCLGCKRMSDNKINIICEDFDKDNIILFFEKNGINMCFTFGLYEFENEMEYWDMPTKLKNYNGKMGFVFDKNINRTDLKIEIDRFIKHNNLEKKD